jgi:putative hydrolase of the HAD superfamily
MRRPPEPGPAPGRRALILDWGGVLTTDFRAALYAFCRREGLPADALHRLLQDDPDTRAAVAAVEVGAIGQREFERRLAALLGVPAAGLVARALADLRPSPGLLAVADEVRSAGVGLALLSNSWGSADGDYVPYPDYGLDRFDVVVISDRVRLRKPGPAIFRLTAGRLGVDPGRCVFVDDTAANLSGAREVGMTAILLERPEQAVAEIRQALAAV